jgi:hypothetical protein
MNGAVPPFPDMTLRHAQGSIQLLLIDDKYRCSNYYYDYYYYYSSFINVLTEQRNGQLQN